MSKVTQLITARHEFEPKIFLILKLIFVVSNGYVHCYTQKYDVEVWQAKEGSEESLSSLTFKNLNENREKIIIKSENNSETYLLCC